MELGQAGKPRGIRITGRGSTSYEAQSVKGGAGTESLADEFGISLAVQCGTGPHHLISGRLVRSLHPYPACTGQSVRLQEDGTHLYDGIKALALPVHIHLASSRATVAAFRVEHIKL